MHRTKAEFQAAYPAHPDFDFTYRVKIHIEDPRSITEKSFIEDIFDVTIRYNCNEFTVTQDSSNIKASDFNPVLIDHGEIKTLTLSFTELPNDGRVCVKDYGLQFWNTDTKEWDNYSAANHGFVHSYSNNVVQI